MSASPARIEDPRRRDGLVRWSGRATQRAAPGPHKQLARALGLKGHSRVSRYKAGDPHSPAAKGIAYVDALARGDRTSAWAQISSEVVVIKRAQYDGVATEVLEARYMELVHEEHALQAEQDKALMHAALTKRFDGVADAVCSHADRLLELASLAEEINERKERGGC